MDESGDGKVLIAEDDAGLRKLVTTALKRKRINAETAADGAEAIKHLEASQWSVLVLDLMMPGTSGWDVIAWLAEHRDRMPQAVMVVSAADRGVLRDLDPTIVNAIIFKPFDVVHLTAYVKAASDLRARDRRRGRTVGG